MSMFQRAAHSCDFATFRYEVVDDNQPAKISDFDPTAKHTLSGDFVELRAGEKLSWRFVYGDTTFQDVYGETPP